MGAKAARVGDATQHGGVIVVGSPTVIVEGMPAARVGDNHTCPMVNPGGAPHVGGPILPPGAATVLIEGQPAARVGDSVTCAGPLDVIAVGASKTEFCQAAPALPPAPDISTPGDQGSAGASQVNWSYIHNYLAVMNVGVGYAGIGVVVAAAGGLVAVALVVWVAVVKVRSEPRFSLSNSHNRGAALPGGFRVGLSPHEVRDDASVYFL